MEILSEIADKIKELRKEKGYTLKDLADKTELSVSFFIPSRKRLILTCNYFTKKTS
jgi:Helix-turn-helix.